MPQSRLNQGLLPLPFRSYSLLYFWEISQPLFTKLNAAFKRVLTFMPLCTPRMASSSRNHPVRSGDRIEVDNILLSHYGMASQTSGKGFFVPATPETPWDPGLWRWDIPGTTGDKSACP